MKRILGLKLGLLLALGSSPGQEVQPSEYQLKAAFLFNFAKFVEWPPTAFPEATTPLVIGVLGVNPFGDDLERTIRGKMLNDHPLEVRECRSAADAAKCHILFISPSERQRLVEIFRGLRGASVLTVSETGRFTESGGMINFVKEGNRIRFQINDAVAREAGLKISSKLLSLALRPVR